MDSKMKRDLILDNYQNPQNRGIPQDKGYKVVPNGRFPLDCYYAILEACDSSSINMVGNFVFFGLGDVYNELRGIWQV